MLTVTSKDNKVYKFIKSLQDKKARSEFFTVEGVKNIYEAQKSGALFKYICFSEDKLDMIKKDLDMSLIDNKNVIILPQDLFDKLSDTVNPQGVLAVLNKNTVQEISVVGANDVFVVLENLQDPGNMGTIIRTCNAAGIKNLVTVGYCTDIFSPKVVRSSMGGIFNIKIKSFNTAKDAVLFFKDHNIATYALTLNGDICLYDMKKWKGVALFAGNESNGLETNTVNMCDNKIKIPMPGDSESLNVSVALSLAVFETVRYSYMEKNFI